MEFLLQDLKSRGLTCNAIMDIGAHVGSWSTLTKAIFPEAKYCLIEPQLEMEEYLKSFCSSSKNSIYYLAGAGAVSGEKSLTIWDDHAGSSFLPFEDDALAQSGKQRKIKIVTVDEIIKSGEFPVPELVKLDVQGYELEALKGAESIFGKTEVFILEVSFFPFNDTPGNPLFADVVNFMVERGYLVYDFGGFSRRPLDGALAQCDICFVKKDSFLRKFNDWS